MLKDKIGLLLNKPLKRVGRASNMLWIQFGELIEVKNYKGISQEKGEYSLHIQCPWRVIQNEAIILGSNDFYIPYDREEKEAFEWDVLGNNLFDMKAQRLAEKVLPIRVNKIEVDDLGSINLYLEKQIVLQVFPVDSITEENWRFINNLTGEHIVFREE